MRIILIVFVCWMLCYPIQAQDKKAQKVAKSITTDDLNAYLSVLASDSLEGRETGERGQKMAAEFIADKFRSFGLTGVVQESEMDSYFQEYPLKKMTYRTSYLKKGELQKENFEDFLYYSRMETVGEEYIDVVFSGVQTMDQLVEMDLKDKFVVIINEEMTSWRNVLATLKKLDAAGTIMILEDEKRYQFILSRYKQILSGDKISLTDSRIGNKILVGNPELASWIFDMPYEALKEEGIGKSSQLIFNADMLVEEITAENVLGFLEGEEKPDEILVITSHYDHIGIADDGRINNGADDDASGTSAVLEMAQAFALAAEKGHRPRRSVLFIAFSGEEKGLLGSKYYTQHPVFPLSQTVTNLNIDMVGRIDKHHEKDSAYVYLVGADRLSQELHDLSESVNQTYVNLELDYTYNAKDDPNRYYYRSDHYNFAEQNVPVIFYYNGTHKDYHQPTDTIDKIEFELLKKRTLLIFYTAWELANRDEPVKLNEIK